MGLSGAPVYWIDDLDGHVRSPSLNMALTSNSIEDRVLGKSETIRASWTAAVFLTGNNYTVPRDLARRVVPINLFFAAEDIDSRPFRHPNLTAWAIREREMLLAALYGLVENWASAGFPKADIRFASYNGWASVIGGILRAAGFSAFLQNRAAIASKGDTETNDMRTLFQMCGDLEGDFKLQRVLDICRSAELFPAVTAKPDQGAISSLGRLLAKYTGRALGETRLVRVQERPAKFRFTRGENRPF